MFNQLHEMKAACCDKHDKKPIPNLCCHLGEVLMTKQSLIPAPDGPKHLGENSDLLSAPAVIIGTLLSRHKHFLTEI